MTDFILSYPVKTLDDQLLLPEGCQHSSETLLDLISQAGRLSYKHYSMLEHGSVKSDIRKFLTVSPFDNMFSKQEDIGDLMSFIGDVHLISPLIESSHLSCLI